MSQGLLWFPLLLAFVLLASLGWLERRRQNLFRSWAENPELAKLDGSGAALLKEGELIWSRFEAGRFQDQGSFDICSLELVELMAFLGRCSSPMNPKGAVALRLIGKGRQMDVPFADADRARRWGDQLMSRARCDL